MDENKEIYLEGSIEIKSIFDDAESEEDEEEEDDED